MLGHGCALSVARAACKGRLGPIAALLLAGLALAGCDEGATADKALMLKGTELVVVDPARLPGGAVRAAP